jgi:hypothetical protein
MLNSCPDTTLLHNLLLWAVMLVLEGPAAAHTRMCAQSKRLPVQQQRTNATCLSPPAPCLMYMLLTCFAADSYTVQGGRAAAAKGVHLQSAACTRQWQW